MLDFEAIADGDLDTEDLFGQALGRAADRLEEPELDVFAALGYQPTPKQQEFHDATEDDILYGGAGGGGKTLAIVMEAIRACIRYPGIRVLILRRTYDELAESVYPEFMRVGWAVDLGGRWNKTDKEVTFPNKSVIRLRYMEDLTDASRRQGGQYQLLLVDERTLMPPGLVAIISNERLRSAHGVPVLGVRSTSNPGGPSHGEVRARYVEPTEHGDRTVTDEYGLTLRFIPAKATDNPHLDAAYHRRLNAIPDPKRRAAMRDGDWGQFEGQMFGEYQRDRHTLAPISLPNEWRRYNGVDWGFTAPWAVLWGAVDEDQRVWIYREIYDVRVGEAEQAHRILDAEAPGEHVGQRYADDAMWATRGDARPIADIYAENGVHLEKAGKGPGSRVIGWQRWHSYLAEAPACPHHRALGWETCPKIHIFRTCPKLLWELENLPHASKGNPEDADTTAPDHAMDAGRYLLLNIGGGPRFPLHDTPDEIERISDYVTPLRPMGAFAVRESDEQADSLWSDDESQTARIAVTGTAPWH